MISPPAGCREELQNSSDLRLTMTAVTELFVEYESFLGFLHHGEFIGERGTSGARCAHHVIARRNPTLGHALLWRGALGCPPGALRTPVSPRSFIDCIIDFVRFRGYFLSRISETKNRELALWHLVNRLVPENA